MSAHARLFLACLLALCAYSASAEPLLARSRYAPTPLPSPQLWLAVDTRPDAISSDTQPLRALIDALAQEVSSPWLAQRTLPATGVALGLLAVTPSAAEVLHPAQALDAATTWPSQTVTRNLSLIRNTEAATTDEQLWPLAQPQVLTLRWPMPDAPVRITELSLDLPMRQTPTRWPSLTLQFADGYTQSLPPVQLAANGSAYLSLHNAITAWQQQGHAGKIPPWPWRILWQAQVADEQGAWAAWQSTQPARVHLLWQDDAATRSGREQWLRQLHSLLAGAGVQLPADDAALLRLSTSKQGSAGSCAASAVRWLRPVDPDAVSGVARWRDQSLAAAPVVTRQQARVIGAVLLGLDRDWAQPVPGRRAWRGGSVFYPCITAAACEQAPPPDFHDETLPASAWLTDTIRGQPLQPLTQQWPVFSQRHAYWRNVIAPPLPAMLRGSGLYVDAGALASAATGRKGYLLWPGSDGSVSLQDGQSGGGLWAWRPAVSAVLWADLTQDAALAVDAADATYAVSANDWALWPVSTAANSDTGLDADGQRWLYGLVDKQLVVLDLTQPEQPRAGFLPILSAGEVASHGAQKTAWGSLSLLPLTLASGQAKPLLLLSAADPASSTKLMLLDGQTGSVLWQAGNQAAAGSQQLDAALTSGWQAAWRTLTASDGSLLAYGVDEPGAVWQLRIAAKPAQTTAIQVSLRRVADFSAPSMLYPYSPSLAWLRDVQGQRYPAIALAAANTAAADATSVPILAFLDAKTTLITASDLPLWNTGTQPPSHTLGWRRNLPAGSQIAQLPRWLDQQLILTSETPKPSAAPCPAWSWQATLYRWPWRADRAGVAQTEATAVLSASASAVGNPLLSVEGESSWLGVSAADSQATKVTVPVAYRQRVRQRQLRAGD